MTTYSILKQRYLGSRWLRDLSLTQHRWPVEYQEQEHMGTIAIILHFPSNTSRVQWKI